jgi:hypothetical protein
MEARLSQSPIDRRGLDRRSVLAAGTTLIGAVAIPALVVGSAGPALAPAGDLLAAVRKFTGGLEPEKLRAASFAWNGPEWRSWNYFGVGGFIKPGLRLEQMTVAQKEAAWDIVGVLLSPAGLTKTRNVMLLQDILAASGNGAGQRSSERFSFSIFGTPAETGTWGFRLEGHHLTHSVTVRDNHIVSVTPVSFSALPNRVMSGKHAGLVTLREEEALARRLIGDVAPKLQARARVSDAALGNILSYAGYERSNAHKVGLAAAELGSAQRDLLWQLVETFAVDHLSPTLAASQRGRIGSGDRAATHFAWYGPNAPEKAFGYRIINDGLVIELGSVDSAAQHLHTIYHDLGNVLGRAA